MVTLYRHGDCQFFDKVVPVCHKMIPVLLEGRFFYQIYPMGISTNEVLIISHQLTLLLNAKFPIKTYQ